MRNIPKPLTRAECDHQHDMLEALKAAETVTVDYTKRDATSGTATGTVKFFSGEPGMDTGSVTIETVDRGPRTINLHRIKVIR